ncbi:MAG: methionyl-tRNA formyltransferase [bacterium]|nr:methionyl-tRNA formyltransferase [bacterium]
MNKLKLVFLGTPKIACNALEKLNKSDDIEICAVITQPDKPAGRGHKMAEPPIKTLAKELGLEVFQPMSIRKDAELLEKLRSYEADFFITIAFGQILSQEVLDIPKIGTINLHASLLPEYRGANPIARAIADGKKVTGVTTMLTSIGVDEGDIVLTEKIDIPDDMTTLDLAVKIANIAPDILYKSMKGLVDKTITPIAQDHSKATFAPKFTKEETFLNFSKPARDLHNMVRALSPKPAASCYYGDTLIKIIETKAVDTYALPTGCDCTNLLSGVENGAIIAKDKNGVYVKTADGILLIKTLKPEGKKEMSAQAWVCGLKTLGCFR